MKKLMGVLGILTLLWACEAKMDRKLSENKTGKTEQEKKSEIGNMKKLSFPDSNNLSKDYLKQNFWRLDYDMAGENLNYLMIVPKNIKPIEVKPTPLSGTGLTLIGKYKTIDKTTPYMEICAYYEHLGNAMQPADWVKGKLKIAGHEIVNQNEIISSQGDRYIDALSRKSDVIARTTEYVNGKGDYIMLSIFCKEKDYETLSETIQFISSSWKLE